MIYYRSSVNKTQSFLYSEICNLGQNSVKWAHMAILKKRDILAQVVQAQTIVGDGVALSGKLEAKHNVQINGIFAGEIIAEGDVIVAQNAEVHGPINAKNATIAGTVNGDIHVVNELDILASGKVFGDISSKVLLIKPGGILSGASIMHTSVEDQKIVQPTYEA